MTDLAREHDAPVTAVFKKRFVLLMTFIHVCGAVFLFLALFIVLSRPLPGDYPAVFLALRNLPAFLLPVLTYAGLAYILLVSMATTVLCVYTLHRIAGPLYRMERVIESYLAGDAVRPAFFRGGDQVPVLATAFNGFVGRLREDRQKWLGIMGHAERFCFQDRATCRSEMEKALAELETLLAKYR